MEDLFLRLFNIGVTAGWIVLAALAVRLILWRRLPGWVKVALWGVVGVRLLFPFSLESVLSLIPSAETVPPTITTSPAPTVNVGVPVVDQVVNPVISQTMAPVPQASINPMQVLVTIAAAVWGVGVLLMLGYLLVSYWRIYRRVRESAPMEQGVRYCDGIAGAFVLGVLRPRIYLSTAIPDEDLPYVLAHERAHLQRGDHVWKPLGYLLLSVYWFHPLLWIAYFLLCRDMESACDEKVLRKLGSGSVKPYAMALVNCSERESKYRVQRCPVAFGETKIKERVKNVLNYRKPKFWVTALSILLVAVIAVCFLTNPVSAKEPDEPITPPNEEVTTGEEPNKEVLIPNRGIPSAEIQAEIANAYYRETGNTWEYFYEDGRASYYGSYGLSYVLFIAGDDQVESSLRIGGYTFCYHSSFEMYVYRLGRFRDFVSACRGGWISSGQISTIWEAHCLTNGKYMMEEETTGEDTTEEKTESYFKYPDVLDGILQESNITSEFALAIKQCCLEQNKKEDKYTTDHIHVDFYGAYGDAYIVLLSTTWNSSAPRVWFGEQLGDYKFVAPHPLPNVYYKGNIYSLTQAYEAGVLTGDRLERFYADYKAYMEAAFGQYEDLVNDAWFF